MTLLTNKGVSLFLPLIDGTMMSFRVLEVEIPVMVLSIEVKSSPPPHTQTQRL